MPQPWEPDGKWTMGQTADFTPQAWLAALTSSGAAPAPTDFGQSIDPNTGEYMGTAPAQPVQGALSPLMQALRRYGVAAQPSSPAHILSLLPSAASAKPAHALTPIEMAALHPEYPETPATARTPDDLGAPPVDDLTPEEPGSEMLGSPASTAPAGGVNQYVSSVLASQAPGTDLQETYKKSLAEHLKNVQGVDLDAAAQKAATDMGLPTAGLAGMSQSNKAMLLLQLGLHTMRAASQPGAGLLGSLAEGGEGALGALKSMQDQRHQEMDSARNEAYQSYMMQRQGGLDAQQQAAAETGLAQQGITNAQKQQEIGISKQNADTQGQYRLDQAAWHDAMNKARLAGSKDPHAAAMTWALSEASKNPLFGMSTPEEQQATLTQLRDYYLSSIPGSGGPLSQAAGQNGPVMAKAQAALAAGAPKDQVNARLKAMGLQPLP